MRFVIAITLLALIVLLAMQILRSSRPKVITAALLPTVPALIGSNMAAVLPAMPGIYMGTSMAGDWRDQLVIEVLESQAHANLHLTGSGLLFEQSSGSLWVPVDALRGAQVGRVIASWQGQYDLFITWQLNGKLLDSVFQPDDGQHHVAWLSALRTHAESNK